MEMADRKVFASDGFKIFFVFSNAKKFSLDICFASHENLASLTANPARPDVCIFRGERSTVQGHGHLKFCLHTKRLDQLATM